MAQMDFDSTLLRRGRSAVTYSDMVSFASTIEERPLSSLLEELPGIAALSETKFLLAATVMRRRFRGETPVDQTQLRVFAGEIAQGVADPDMAERIRSLFASEVA